MKIAVLKVNPFYLVQWRWGGAGDRGDALRTRLDEQLKSGPITTEGWIQLASWASALGGEGGACYLLSILRLRRQRRITANVAMAYRRGMTCAE